jgi:MinD-like ATPase involved in chromosome partitioning or flagellar assembly
MVTTCWSVKGGSGTTVIAACLALSLAVHRETLLVDLVGDLPAALGVSEPTGPGLEEAIALGDALEPGALRRIELPVTDQLTVLPAGRGDGGTNVANVVRELANDERAIVADLGTMTSALAEALRANATRSLLVIRPCYLALRRAAQCTHRPHGIVVVREGGRALTATDVASVVGAPVVAEVDVDPALARLVDAGLLASRVPGWLTRALKDAA